MDDAYLEDWIVYGGVEVDGRKAQGFAVRNAGRDHLDEWIADAIAFWMGPNVRAMDVSRQIDDTTDFVITDRVKQSVTGEGVDSPAIIFAI